MAKQQKRSAKSESIHISQAIAKVTAIRKRISGTKHYVENMDAFCNLCKIRVSTAHCYEKNGEVVAYLCTRCNNSVKPKKRVTKIIYTPM